MFTVRTLHQLKYRMDRDSEGALPLEGMAQDGDSGGPAFITVSGTRYLAGVNSGTFENNPCDWGSVDQYNRLSEQAEFIRSVTSRDGTIAPWKEWVAGGGDLPITNAPTSKPSLPETPATAAPSMAAPVTNAPSNSGGETTESPTPRSDSAALRGGSAAAVGAIIAIAGIFLF